jgi:hypothetical protein
MLRVLPRPNACQEEIRRARMGENVVVVSFMVQGSRVLLPDGRIFRRDRRLLILRQIRRQSAAGASGNLFMGSEQLFQGRPRA